jgi:hypothetical protein
MNSTPVVQEPIDSGLAERDLCEIIDALETGLLQLQRERNDLRDALERAGAPAPEPKRAAAKKAAKKATKKAVKKVAKKKTATKTVTAPKAPEPAAPEPVAAAPKAASKSRPALGRTLTMIRSPRTPNP